MVKMKVALCTEILYPLYGVERRVYEMAKRLPKYGIEVEVFTSTSRNHFKHLNINQVSHCTITNPPKRNYAFCMGYMFNLFRQLMKSDYNLIHAEGHLSLIPCSLAAVMRKKPSIATVHDMYLTDWRKMYKSVVSFGGLPFEVVSCKMPFNRVLTVNSSLKAKMEGILKINPKKIEILHSGIDTKYIDSVKSGGKDGSIVYIGRLVPQKSVDTLIKAYSLLPADVRRKHTLKIIGEGSERAKLESLSKRLGVEVNFVGKIEHHEAVLKELKAGSLFVLPSKRESFGITILEAMFSGIPVISTATEGPSDHIENGKTGFLVRGVKDMAEKMGLVLTDNVLKKNIIKNARISAEKHDWDIIVKNIADRYEQLVK